MKSFRIYIFIVFLFVLIGCSSDPLEKLIPPSALEGSIAPIRFLKVEKQLRDKETFVEAVIAVPHDIKREQVKPTMLSALKELKQKFPDKKRLLVYLCPGGEKTMRLGSAIYAGRGEYAEKEVIINHWIPSQEQIQKIIDLNAESKDYLIPVPKLMSKQDFDEAVEIAALYYSYYKISHDPDLSYQQAAEQLGISKTTAKEFRDNLLSYYGLGQKTEVIK